MAGRALRPPLILSVRHHFANAASAAVLQEESSMRDDSEDAVEGLEICPLAGSTALASQLCDRERTARTMSLKARGIGEGGWDFAISPSSVKIRLRGIPTGNIQQETSRGSNATGRSVDWWQRFLMVLPALWIFSADSSLGKPDSS